MDRIVEIALLVLALVASFLGRKEHLGRFAVEFMLEAERMSRNRILEDGVERMKYVVTQLVDKLPPDLKAYLVLIARLKGQTIEEFVEAIAQAWYDKVIY